MVIRGSAILTIKKYLSQKLIPLFAAIDKRQRLGSTVTVHKIIFNAVVEGMYSGEESI